MIDEYVLCDILCALIYIKYILLFYITIRGIQWIRQRY
jgi:hypothetical protein